jgi:hypothetical protein
MRPINVIANDIRKEWKKVHYAAKPYLDAMHQITDAKSRYGYDSGMWIVMYFLSNSSTFRGQRAKELKAELKQHIK